QECDLTLADAEVGTLSGVRRNSVKDQRVYINGRPPGKPYLLAFCAVRYPGDRIHRALCTAVDQGPGPGGPGGGAGGPDLGRGGDVEALSLMGALGDRDHRMPDVAAHALGSAAEAARIEAGHVGRTPG